MKLPITGHKGESAVAFAESLYFFKHSLPQVETFNCAKGGMKHFNEEKVGSCG